jgi:hypothetical protein
MIDFDALNVGDTVCYIRKTTHVNVPYYGTVLEVKERDDAEDLRSRGLGTKIFRCKFKSRGAGAPNGWFHGYELRKCEDSAEECERAYSSVPLPRWA